METTEQAVPVENTVDTSLTTTPTTEGQETASSTAPAETVAAPEEVKIDLPPIEPFKPQQPAVPAEDYYTPDKVLSAFKGKEKELFEAAAKATGLSDFALGALPYIRNQESLAAYWQATNTDWNQLPKEQLLEMKLKEEYSKIGGLSADKISRLVQSDLRNVYGIGVDYDDPESEEVIKAEYKALRDSHDFRQAKIAQQKEVLTSLAHVQQPQQEQQATEPDPVQVMEAQRQAIVADERVKKILQSKVVPLGDFNYGLENPADTMANIYDAGRWQHKVSLKNEDGSLKTDAEGNPQLNYELLMQVSAFVENPKNFIEALVNHGVTLGKKQLVDERENIQSNQSFATATDTDDWETKVAKAIQARQNNR